MSGIPVTRKHGPRSFPVSATVTGGQLCAAGAGGEIAPAGANSTKVLGVAINDAVPVADFESGTVSGVLNAAPKPNRAALAYGGDEVPVTYAADAVFGDKLKAAAAGTVTPFVSGTDTDPALIVGTCTQPEGVDVSENAVGLMRTV